jgi:hypothetical protein
VPVTGVPAGAGLMSTAGARHGLAGFVGSVSSIRASPSGERDGLRRADRGAAPVDGGRELGHRVLADLGQDEALDPHADAAVAAGFRLALVVDDPVEAARVDPEEDRPAVGLRLAAEQRRAQDRVAPMLAAAVVTVALAALAVVAGSVVGLGEGRFAGHGECPGGGGDDQAAWYAHRLQLLR